MRILGFSGSTRRGSFNQKLVAIALAAAADSGAETTLIDLREFPMPLYDADLEQAGGLPPPAREFRNLLKATDGVLISSPEYNGGLSAVLKNAIDWSTRPDPECSGESPLVAWRGKVVGLMAASPGRLGGIRGLTHLRTILSGIGGLVLANQIAVPGVHELLASRDTIDDERVHTAVRLIGEEVAAVAGSVRFNPCG